MILFRFPFGSCQFDSNRYRSGVTARERYRATATACSACLANHKKKNLTEIGLHFAFRLSFDTKKKSPKLNSQWIPILWARYHRPRLRSQWWRVRKLRRGLHYMIFHRRRQMKSKFLFYSFFCYLYCFMYFISSFIWNVKLQFFISNEPVRFGWSVSIKYEWRFTPMNCVRLDLHFQLQSVRVWVIFCVAWITNVQKTVLWQQFVTWINAKGGHPINIREVSDLMNWLMRSHNEFEINF